MKHLFSCLRRFKAECVLAPLFKLLEASLELITPLIVALIVDRGIAEGDKSFIVLMCLVLVGMGLVGCAFSIAGQFFAARAAVGCSAELRSRLFRKLQSFSFSEIDEMGTSTMITRMTSDVNQVQTGVNMTLRLFLRSPFIVFGAMAMAFTVDAKVALVFVAVIPLLAVAVYSVMGACIPLYKKVQAKLDRVFLSVRENLAGVRVIRAFSMEEKERRAFDEHTHELERAQKKVGRISALTGPITYILINLALIALLYFSAGRVDGGILLKGDVIALYGYLSQILVELIKLANLIVTMTKAVSCQQRVGKVLDREGEPSVLEPMLSVGHADNAAVRFEHVSFAYAGGGNALTDITFMARPGETIGIIGGTGAGKSTLVHLLPRFYAATQGRVLLKGRDVRGVPFEELREKVGIVPQKAVLFEGTIRSNLLWGNENATDEELMEAVRLAQAEDVVASKGGLDAPVEQEGKNLSGGQRQRLTIARALVKKPEILILDDSASALDYATDARLRVALRTLDSTVFLVSQRAATVLHADLILVLDGGKVAGMGRHEDLLKSCEIYKEIYHTQFRDTDEKEAQA